jgi:hypothetical protein
MKKLMSLLLILVVVIPFLPACNKSVPSTPDPGPTPTKIVWEAVGNTTIGQNMFANSVDLKIDKNGVPYVAFLRGTDYYGQVMKYDSVSNSWKKLGATGEFSGGTIGSLKLALDNNNVPYVAFQDNANGAKATVKKYNSGSDSWTTVGSAGFSSGTASALSFDVESDTEMYVGYVDGSVSSQATVAKYDSTVGAWKLMGQQGIYPCTVRTVSLVKNNGKLFVAFGDNSSSATAHVYYYDIISQLWINQSTINYNWIDLQMVISNDINSELYLVTDASTPFELSKHNEITNSWDQIGDIGDTGGGGVYGFSICSDGTNQYICYIDSGGSRNWFVKKYANGQWVTIDGYPGKVSFDVIVQAHYPSICVYNHIPYIAFYSDYIKAIVLLKNQP